MTRKTFGVGLGPESVVERPSMEILLVGNELGPWLFTSDTQDELSAFGKAFRQLGHDVTLVVPYDSAYERGGLLVSRRLSPLELPNGHVVTVYDAQLATGAKVVLFGMPAGADATLHSNAAPTVETLRAVSVFARAVAAYVELRADQGQPIDMVHLFDWTTALAGLAIRTACRTTSCSIALSVRDSAQLGLASASLAADLGDSLLSADQTTLGADTCLLKAGLLAADVVVLPTEGAIRRLTSGAHDPRIVEVMQQLRAPVVAVSAGVDYARVNPATNPGLLSRYDAEDLRNKSANKTDWLRHAGLSLEPRPLVLLPGPLTAAYGGDLLLSAIDRIVDFELSVGMWESTLDDVAMSRALRKMFASRGADFAIVEQTNDEQIHRGFAAADFVLYPKREGRGPMCHLAAQRYGAIAIADGNSPIGERVVDVDAALSTGTGFLFSDATADGLVSAVARAVSAYQLGTFDKLKRRVMRLDSSWDRPARRLIQLYQKARNGGQSIIPQAG